MKVLADKEEEVLLRACINNIGGTIKSILNRHLMSLCGDEGK